MSPLVHAFTLFFTALGSAIVAGSPNPLAAWAAVVIVVIANVLALGYWLGKGAP